MKSHFSLILFCGCILAGAPFAATQAGDAIQIPARQQELTRILSKYNALYDSAINEMQQEKVAPEFYRVFCASIPKGQVSGWVGEVQSVDNYSVSGATDKGIRIILSVSTENLSSGSFGVELVLGNDYFYGVDAQNTKPHPPTVFPVGSPLYKIAYNLRSGDTVIFSGNFVPYTSERACAENNTSYFSLFHFTSIKKIGHGLTF